MKCRFKNKCPHFSEDSMVCSEDGGMYYSDGTSPAGCYIRMEEEE